MARFFFMLALVLGIAAPAHAATRYVSPTGSATPPYTNWASAATNIQQASDVSTNGDTILVAPGVYDTGGGTYGTESLASRVVVPGQVTLISRDGPASTIIVGAGPLGPDAVRCVRLGPNATLRGFTLTGGHTQATGTTVDAQGGGAYLAGGNQVSNCIITGNQAVLGGGVYVTDFPSFALRNCVLSGNSASNGGGIYVNNYGAILYSVLRDNEATDRGGGVYMRYGEVVSSVIYSNRARTGAGICAVEPGYISHCTVAANNATQSGGGLWALTYTRVKNCIIYFNTAGTNDNWLSLPSSTVSNSCTWPTGGTTRCLDANPGFVNINGDNFRLFLTSPCIDRGSFLEVTNDVEGRARSIDGPDSDGDAAPDLGAYEYASSEADSDEDGYSDQEEWWQATDPASAASYFTVAPGRDDATGSLNSVTFSPSATGRLYTLEYSDDLASGTWTNHSPSHRDVPGTGEASGTFVDETPITSRFYRIRIAAP
jgi:hypothetical protein